MLCFANQVPRVETQFVRPPQIVYHGGGSGGSICGGSRPLPRTVVVVVCELYLWYSGFPLCVVLGSPKHWGGGGGPEPRDP